jgi:hypothetical protein
VQTNTCEPVTTGHLARANPDPEVVAPADRATKAVGLCGVRSVMSRPSFKLGHPLTSAYRSLRHISGVFRSRPFLQCRRAPTTCSLPKVEASAQPSGVTRGADPLGGARERRKPADESPP